MTTRSGVIWPPPQITPDEYEAVARQLVSQYSQAERDLIKILDSGVITDWNRAFTSQQLSQVQAVLQTLGSTTDEYIRYSLPALYERGLAIADGYLMQPELVPIYQELRASGLGHLDTVAEMTRRGIAPGGLSVAAHPGEITPMDLSMTRLHREAVVILAENMASSLGNARSYSGQWLEIMVDRARGLRNASASYDAAWLAELKIRENSLDVLQKALLKGETHREASKKLIAQLKQNGLTCFRDRAGKKWTLENYADMVVKTIQQETARHGLTNRLQERGADLVKVTDHADECELCKPWEGKILSITGATEGYTTLNSALTSGLFHPRCSHALVPYVKARDLLKD